MALEADQMTISELRHYGRQGDHSALMELGRRAVDFECCEDYLFCEHKEELDDLHFHLNCEIPPDCPKCGQWLTDV